MEQNVSALPIDIHVPKLVDWLVSRRHIKDGWQRDIEVIRGKITTALNDMPAHPDIAKLLSGSYLNYFHCRRIVEILRETEKDTKNIFGYYSSRRMQDWQEIVKLYESDCVYLAEAAQLLFRNVQYEVPGVRRQIAKHAAEQEECERREAACLRNAEGMRVKFRQACKQMDIAGDDVKRELVALLDGLPAEYVKIEAAVAGVEHVCKFYDAAVAFSLGGREVPECVPVLRYIAAHGNVTTYEWRYGEPPLKVEPAPAVEWEFDDEVKRKDSTDSDDFEKIDFGEAEAAAAGDFIDFGDGGGEIDWGANGGEEANGAIDWGPGGQESLEVSLEDAGITVEGSGVEGGTAREEDALTLLDNPRTRAALADDLVELEAFLERRLFEMGGSGDGAGEGQVLALSLFQDAPAEVQMQTPESVQQMLTEVRAVLELLTNVRIQHLFLIKSSPKYVDRLAHNVNEKLEIAKKLEGNAEAMREKRAEAAKMQTKLQPELKLLIERTKVLQKQIEDDISKKYKNRPVHLMAAGLS